MRIRVTLDRIRIPASAYVTQTLIHWIWETGLNPDPNKIRMRIRVRLDRIRNHASENATQILIQIWETRMDPEIGTTVTFICSKGL